MPSVAAQGLVQTSGAAYPVVTALSGAVAIASKQAYGTFANTSGGDNSPACDAIKDTLLAAGWSLAQPIQAAGFLFAPFGWGATGFLRTILILTYDGITTTYKYYDPSFESPTDHTSIWVPIGGTSAASQQNLVLAININSAAVVLASIYDATHILLTAIPVGTLGNYIEVGGTGSTSVGQTLGGGGWQLKSSTQIKDFGYGNTAQFTITATTNPPGTPERVWIQVTCASYTVSFILRYGGWQMIADNYQAAFFCNQAFEAGDSFIFNSYLWLSALYIDPATLPGLTFSAFIMQTGNLPVTTSLGAGGGMTIDCFVNAYHSTTTQGQQGWSIAMYHSEGGKIQDPTGLPMIVQPWVMMPAGYVAESRMCGQVFDCFAWTEQASLLQQAAQQNANYRCVASQASPTGSLWIKTGEITNTGQPSASNPPHLNPTSAAGTGDVGASNPQTGTLVLQQGTANFDSSWIGKTIEIDGGSYTVTAVPSSTVLSFQPPPPSSLLGAIGISWSFNQ